MKKCIEHYNPKGVTYPHDYTRRLSWWETHCTARGSIPKIIISPLVISNDYKDLEKGSPLGEIIHGELYRRDSGLHLSPPRRL
ncbi:hypothetical protein L5515_006796 [Caenorhabditis briggsae]|uniref:Uncharacterized protein n=1 Tax=Caenorhabditis briggsae TaxID=6238 RepID=A0AAE9JKE7_CAEBR|nr:hypothetical protein L5515_006796 [Caenorhabditis briggsae]